MDFFENLSSYQEYLEFHPLHDLLSIDKDKYGPLDGKVVRETFYSVNPNLMEAYSAELDDLIRLHFLLTSRKVTTVLEFGVGKSTAVIDHALQLNKAKYENFVCANLRRTNRFECFSVDNNLDWIDICKEENETTNVHYHHSECSISTFNDRICTYYDSLPNVCPDFIYLDAPDQFSINGEVRGISTKHPDRVPMAADLLAMEHFFLPGTFILVDGRSANARFLKTNFQRNWAYHHCESFDQHFFELTEQPLGIYNKRQIDFCLGESFYKRIDQWSSQGSVDTRVLPRFNGHK